MSILGSLLPMTIPVSGRFGQRLLSGPVTDCCRPISLKNGIETIVFYARFFDTSFRSRHSISQNESCPSHCVQASPNSPSVLPAQATLPFVADFARLPPPRTHRHMRLDMLLVNHLSQNFRGAVIGVADQPVRFEIKAIFNPLNHRLGGVNLIGLMGGCRLNVNHNPGIN